MPLQMSMESCCQNEIDNQKSGTAPARHDAVGGKKGLSDISLVSKSRDFATLAIKAGGRLLFLCVATPLPPRGKSA